MSLYSSITENLQFVAPEFYKNRYFKKLKNLHYANVLQRNVKPELLWLRSRLQRSDVFLDVGANTGSYLYVLENVLRHQNIYGFEPNKRLWSRLKRIFPEMNILPLALSDTNTFAQFKVPVLNGKRVNSRGTLRTDFKESNESGSEINEVKVIQLDDWVEIDHIKRLNFIKIDVEGNELKTLRGARKTIEKFRPEMMVEIEQRHHSQTILEIIREIESWRYASFYLERPSFELKPVTEDFLKKQQENEVKDKSNYINNIIFIPKK